MSSPKEILQNGLVPGKSMSEYIKVLESSAPTFRMNDLYQYSNFYEVICGSDISLEVKKTLILALVKAGVPIHQSYHCNDALIKTLQNRDLPLLVFLVKKTPLQFTSNYYNLRECDALGSDVKCNQFTINLLTKINTTLILQKAFLRGAIRNNNTTLIKYIIEVLKPKLHIPTSQVRSSHGLYSAFAESGNVELLKYFESHGYNIHECQRELLNACYKQNRDLSGAMIEYILSEQEKSSASDEYTEKLANSAFREGDIAMLEKFGSIGLAIKWTQIVDMLKSDKPVIFFKTALERFIKREVDQCMKYHREWKKIPNSTGYAVIGDYHVNQVWKLAKTRKPIWECFKQHLPGNALQRTIELADAKDCVAKKVKIVPETHSDEEDHSSED